MGFSRSFAPDVVPESGALTSAMVGIGMGFAAMPSPIEPNIEDTLLFASIEAMEKDDLRVLAVLVTWFGVHHAWVNADRLTKLAGAAESPRVRALWTALATWQSKDRRFERLGRAYRGPPIELLSVGTEFQIGRHGEDPRFEGSALRVPANVLRDRQKDVVTPDKLVKRHRAYRWRVTIGPSYRADLWAALEMVPGLHVAELARRTYSSFASAWAVRRDFHIAAGAGRPSRSAQLA